MKIGFIGTGNMGMALIKGYVKSDTGAAERIYAFDTDSVKLEAMAQELKISSCSSIEELMGAADVVVLAVKPNIYGKVLPTVKKFISENQVIVSIAAGISIDFLEQAIGKSVKIVRVMPNTPAMVNESMSAVCRNGMISDSEFSEVVKIFASIGKAEVVDEKLIDAVVAVSGSSPAYIFMFIEALADGAVQQGMPREQAYRFAAQAMIGSAKMVAESGMHPGQLKDMVCSPGGATIEAVKVLEERGFRSAVMEAAIAAGNKSKEMGKTKD